MSRYCLCLLLFLGSFASLAEAHPISMSSAVIDVKAGAIDVEIEIMLEDLVLFHRLAADGEMKYSAEDLRRAATAHRDLLLQWFTILDGEGQRLKGEVKSQDAKEIEDAGVGQTELMRRTVRYQFTYPLASAPKFLTFQQKMGGDTSVLPAVMDLHVLKDGSVGDKPSQILYGRPHTTEFNWDQQPTGKRLSMSELRAQREQQKRDRLGIASYTGLYSFLYLTRFEVRHELLIPLVTLEQWVPIHRQDKEFLTVDEQQKTRQSLEEFFKSKCQVTINGQPVEAQLSRLNFFGLDINDFALNTAPRRVNVAQARVGVILTFPARQAPQSVDVKWSAYSEHAPYVHSVIMVGNEKPAEHDFQSLDETYHWSGQLSAPSVSPVPAPQAGTSTAELKPQLTQLLNNIYSAFEYREDGAVYDALATSVEGELLKELYLHIKRSLIIAEQGGALSRVTHLEVLDIKPAPAVKGTTGSTFEITWKLSADTEHWGHVHLRTSQYRAKLTISTADEHWKLQKFQILDEQRLAFETSIRGYDPSP